MLKFLEMYLLVHFCANWWESIYKINHKFLLTAYSCPAGVLKMSSLLPFFIPEGFFHTCIFIYIYTQTLTPTLKSLGSVFLCGFTPALFLYMFLLRHFKTCAGSLHYYKVWLELTQILCWRWLLILSWSTGCFFWFCPKIGCYEQPEWSRWKSLICSPGAEAVLVFCH